MGYKFFKLLLDQGPFCGANGTFWFGLQETLPGLAKNLTGIFHLWGEKPPVFQIKIIGNCQITTDTLIVIIEAQRQIFSWEVCDIIYLSTKHRIIVLINNQGWLNIYYFLILVCYSYSEWYNLETHLKSSAFEHWWLQLMCLLQFANFQFINFVNLEKRSVDWQVLVNNSSIIYLLAKYINKPSLGSNTFPDFTLVQSLYSTEEPALILMLLNKMKVLLPQCKKTCIV